MTMLDFLIFGLATYRLTRLLTRDTIFDALRNKVWEKYPPHEAKIGYVFTCGWCMSIWSASLLLTSSMISPVFDVVLIALALSAIAGLLTAYEDR